MVKVTPVVPEPAETTYTLEGITQQELNLLTALLGRTIGEIGYELYKEMKHHSQSGKIILTAPSADQGAFFAIKVDVKGE